jgi:hypothetical protein
MKKKFKMKVMHIQNLQKHSKCPPPPSIQYNDLLSEIRWGIKRKRDETPLKKIANTYNS